MNELLGMLAERGFVAVVGPSGIGKSSVVRAGLVPAVREGRIPGSESWVTDLYPGSYPFEELAAALLVSRSPGLPSSWTSSNGTSSAWPEWSSGSSHPDTELLLVVDQFEELPSR